LRGLFILPPPWALVNAAKTAAFLGQECFCPQTNSAPRTRVFL